MQKELQKHLGYDIASMSTEERTLFIKEFSIHLNQETNEMLYELPFFKPWKDYSSMSVEQQAEAIIKARKEFIDMLHFFMNIGLALDMDEDTILSMYLEKNQENYKRQQKGYTHDVSYR